MTKFKCILCGKTFEGYGNNAYPLANGRCCDFCNIEVIIARIKRIKEERANEKNN